MIEELKSLFCGTFIATDLMDVGLKQSYKRNPDIMHIRCDFTDAPFNDGVADLVFALNVLEHITDDEKVIAECRRVLKEGGHFLAVVPRGNNLYDYFDEALFHKRRYAHGELRAKCQKAGFDVVKNFHYAWICYPAFWLKKKWNRLVGRRLSASEKIERTRADLNSATDSLLARLAMRVEYALPAGLSPGFGVREFILCKK